MRVVLGGLGLLAISSSLFYLKYQVFSSESHLNTLKKEISTLNEEIHLLEAEWTYLNSPERLRTLAVKYLDLVPPSSSQVAAASQLIQKLHVSF